MAVEAGGRIDAPASRRGLMSLRVKLVGAVMLVALIVPVLGGVAINRVFAINDDVTTLSDELPELVLVKDLERSQREQQMAVLAYVSSGNREELQRFQEMSQAFDAQLAELQEAAERNGGDGVSAELLEQIAEQRSAFQSAAGQLLGARATVERNLADLRAREDEIVEELASLRRRYLPSATSAPVDPATIPGSVRAQVNELILGTEGMLHIIGLQFALATGYTITPEESARQQFDGATPVFVNWLSLANAAGGADDQAILARVRNRYINQFEPAGRSMMQATDFSTRSRSSFSESSSRITELLNEIVQQQLVRVNAAESNARSIAGDASRLLIVVTLSAFLLAGTLGVILANRIVNPLVRLRNIAEQVSRGDVENIEVDVHSNDEVGDLADAFRRMMVSIKFLMSGDGDVDGRDQIVRS
jgi:HAMP domain-containing protein